MTCLGRQEELGHKNVPRTLLTCKRDPSSLINVDRNSIVMAFRAIGGKPAAAVVVRTTSLLIALLRGWLFSERNLCESV